MKHGKRPTVEQKVLIRASGRNFKEWLVVKNLQDQLHIVHRETRELRVINKDVMLI